MSEAAVRNAVAVFVEAMKQGDLEAALACYEDNAAFVAEPGRVLVGRLAIREALAGMIRSGATIVTHAQTVLCAGDLALFQSRWSLRAGAGEGGPPAAQAESADVLRRGDDGRWRIAIDNPWGARVLAP